MPVADFQASIKGRRESTDPLLNDKIDQNSEQPENKGNFGFARNATSSLKRCSKMSVANFHASRKGRRESTDPLLDTNIDQNIEQPKMKETVEMQEMLPLLQNFGTKYP